MKTLTNSDEHGTDNPVSQVSVGPSQQTGQQLAAEPSGELAFDRAKEAVSALRGQGRQANGQAGPGNTLSLRHGLRSTQLLDNPDIATWHGEAVGAITSDLGGDAELSALARGTVREAARLEIILASLGTELLEHGVLTGKGKTRSATNVYLKTLDRYLKIVGTLGLQRRTKRLDLAQAFAAHEQGLANG